MRKIFTIMVLVLALAEFSSTSAQVAKSAWGFGFGFSYPRLISTNLLAKDNNYGGFLSIQRNFSEHVAVRLNAKYVNMRGSGTNTRTGQWGTATIHNAYGSGDLMYYFVPCESFSPYLIVGVGGGYYWVDDRLDFPQDSAGVILQVNFGIGSEIRIGDAWRIRTELDYHTVGTDIFDNMRGTASGGYLGGREDSYMSFDLGLLWYFSQDEPSKICQLYEGITVEAPPVDYDRIESIVKQYVPREIVKEVVVEKPVTEAEKRWILVGVAFDFNSAKLKEESYPALLFAVQTLLQNPDMNVEIQGHTDNVGSEKNNLKISEDRAKSVKNYLVARGVAASRLTTKGYGFSQPIADNSTPEGRAQNRRIEFKVLK